MHMVGSFTPVALSSSFGGTTHRKPSSSGACLVRAVAGVQVETEPVPQLLHERDIAFQSGMSFFRPQSIFSRDLAVLSAAVRRQELGGSLHVLDLMAGSGVRGMRYLQHSQAGLVWSNDCSTNTHAALVANLSAAVAAVHPGRGAVLGGPAQVALPLLDQSAWDWALPARASAAGAQTQEGGGGRAGPATVARITHEEGSRLLMWCALQRQLFDLIDIDSFGGDVSFVGLALGALRYGGLLCLTSTAGPVAAGRDPVSAQSMYGMHLAPVPHANEQGLRMLLGVACREALKRGLQLTPLWSLYSPHGPVFRVMVRVERAAGRRDVVRMQRHCGFVLRDGGTGEARVAGWADLAAAMHRQGGPGQPPALSGPMWLGPLQDTQHLTQLLATAEQRGWAGRDSCQAALPWTKKGGVRSLAELLQLLIAESDVRLPPWYVPVNDIAKGRLCRPPPRDMLISALQSRGYAASATHIDSKALRTDAPLAEVVAACLEDLAIPKSN